MTTTDDNPFIYGLTDPTATPVTNIVFIDGSVPDLQDLIAGVAPGDQVFVLDPGIRGRDRSLGPPNERGR